MGFYMIDEKEAVCANCAHYYQHYVKDERKGGFMLTYSGHCYYPNRRAKNKKPGEIGCVHWDPIQRG